MEKIPVLFETRYDDYGRYLGISDQVREGFEWVLNGEGTATEKIDGSACAVINGEFYKRYDAKKGKTPPPGAIPCCDPDPVTGHWPHWVKVDFNSKADKWLASAYETTMSGNPVAKDVLRGSAYITMEAFGRHFNGNPYGAEGDRLTPHGMVKIDLQDRSYNGIKEYLRTHEIEGIVFWKDKKPQCKIRRKDFGFPWPTKEEEK